MKWEKVYTINVYWDGPRNGVADFEGRPHIYQSLFQDSVDENDNETEDVFALSPIEPELLKLVLEDWEIWLRWDAAFKNGEADIDTHPAMPADRKRHNELVELIGDRMKITNESCIKVSAYFRHSRPSQWSGVEVLWQKENA